MYFRALIAWYQWQFLLRRCEP